MSDLNAADQPIVPPEIHEKILKLKRLEVELGHLPPDAWTLDKLQSVAWEDDTAESLQKEHETDVLFGEICKELSAVHFNAEAIAQAINGELYFEGVPKYCNGEEVSEALE